MIDHTPSHEPDKNANFDLNEVLKQLAASSKPKIQTRDIQLSDSQASVVARLENLFKLQLLNPSGMGCRVRTHALVAGPSGSGKSTAVQFLARRVGLPFLSVSVGQWTIWNARNSKYTLADIGDFVRKNPAGIIFVDEIDKLTNRFSKEQYWASAVSQELYSLLDGARLESANFNDADREHLRSHFFLVAAGAWQSCWKEAIQSDDSVANYALKILENTGDLPEELFLRFADPLHVIAPPDETELVNFLIRVHRNINAPVPDQDELFKLAKAASSSGRAIRFVENYATQLLVSTTTDISLGKLLLQIPAVKPSKRDFLGESKEEASKRLFNELRTAGDAIEKVTHEITGAILQLPPEALEPLYRAIALDSLSPTVLSDYQLSNRELDALPSSIRMDERFADIGQHRVVVRKELMHAFEKIGQAALNYTTIGKEPRRKANECVLTIYGARTAGQLRELLLGSKVAAWPHEFSLLLESFVRTHGQWERCYYQLVALHD